MSGDWERIATADSWHGMVHFIDTYYKNIRGLSWRDNQMLPVPKDFEATFADQYDNIYVVYELPAYSKYAYPDIDEDFTDGHRDYIREKYYDDDDYCGDPVPTDWDWRDYLPPPMFVAIADRKSPWFLGVLNDI